VKRVERGPRWEIWRQGGEDCKKQHDIASVTASRGRADRWRARRGRPRRGPGRPCASGPGAAGAEGSAGVAGRGRGGRGRGGRRAWRQRDAEKGERRDKVEGG
jgi:hypothetical protein